MTMTPEQAAETLIGRYSLFDKVTTRELDIWGITAYMFSERMRGLGMTPCKTCGAYRRADSCQVCDEAGKVVVT